MGPTSTRPSRPALPRERLLAPEDGDWVPVEVRNLVVPLGLVEAAGVALLGTGVEAGDRVAEVPGLLLERAQQDARHALAAVRRDDVHLLDLARRRVEALDAAEHTGSPSTQPTRKPPPGGLSSLWPARGIESPSA